MSFCLCVCVLICLSSSMCLCLWVSVSVYLSVCLFFSPSSHTLYPPERKIPPTIHPLPKKRERQRRKHCNEASRMHLNSWPILNVKQEKKVEEKLRGTLDLACSCLVPGIAVVNLSAKISARVRSEPITTRPLARPTPLPLWQLGVEKGMDGREHSGGGNGGGDGDGGGGVDEILGYTSLTCCCIDVVVVMVLIYESLNVR